MVKTAKSIKIAHKLGRIAWWLATAAIRVDSLVLNYVPAGVKRVKNHTFAYLWSVKSQFLGSDI